VGEHLELVPHRVIPPDAGVDRHALLVGRARLADAAVREDAVAAVEPAVGPPDEAVERLVRVLIAPAVEQLHFGSPSGLSSPSLSGMNSRYGAAPTHTPPKPTSRPLTRFSPS
jgi:hypothetical protein